MTTEWPPDDDGTRGDIEERAAIMEYDAHFTRDQAERMAIMHAARVPWLDVFRKMRLGLDGCSNQLQLKLEMDKKRPWKPKPSHADYDPESSR